MFVEVEGSERGIAAMAEALGRREGDYVLDSCTAACSPATARRNGLPAGDMLF